MEVTAPAPKPFVFEPSPRRIYLHRLATEPFEDGRREVFAAYELTPDGLEAIWPENGRDAKLAVRPSAMSYRGPKADPPFAFVLDGGNYDKPHEIAQSIADFFGEPVAYALLTGYNPSPRLVNPSRPSR